MKLLRSTIVFFIVLIVILISTSFSYADEDKLKKRALGYIEKLEELIIDAVPESKKEQVKKIFDELKEYIEKELNIDDESEPLKETMWLRRANLFAT